MNQPKSPSAGVFAALLLLAPTATAQVSLEPLETVRDAIVFPELSLQEKRVIAEQAQILLRDLYVHRFDKLDFYPGLEDPVPAIQAVVDRVDELSTAELEETIYRIFVEQRDLHLNYIFPSPHADYRSFIPLTFARTASNRDFFEVRVASVNAELFERFAPNARVPAVGDLVIEYDGLPIRRAVRRQLRTAQGANRFGGFSRAIGQMTFVSHLLHLVPPEDEVTLTLRASRRPRDGRPRNYSITLPWIAEVPTPDSAGTLRTAPRRAILDPRSVREELTRAENLWQAEFNDLIDRHDLRAETVYPTTPSQEPELTWGIIENRFGRFGYLRLDSFVPENGTTFALAEIRRLVFEEFVDTDGLIFDVRENGGGSIGFADRLSQLFMRDESQTVDARLLNTDLNRRIFNETFFAIFSNPIWRQVINEAEGSGMLYSAPGFFTTDEAANALGQVYYGPVAVLTDARSYSATDIFSCAMRDNRAALVYGQDPRTGAGGANVVEHSAFSTALPSVFEALPTDHRMRVSWRQLLRFGPREGRLIEDFGCEANIDVSQTLDDLLTGGERQLRTITRSLVQRSRSPRYQSAARTLQNGLSVSVTPSDLTYPLFVRNTPFVNVLVNGELVEQKPVFAGRRDERVNIELPAQLEIGSINRLVLEGSNRPGRRLWNVKRDVVVFAEKLEVGPSGLGIDFEDSGGPTPLTFFNQGPAEDGWQVNPPYLQVGYNPTYADRVRSDAVLLFDLRQLPSARLEVDFEFDTEPASDFVEILVIDSESNGISLFRESGRQSPSTTSFDLSGFAGQDSVQVRFRFTSGIDGVAPGVRIRRVALNP